MWCRNGQELMGECVVGWPGVDGGVCCRMARS